MAGVISDLKAKGYKIKTETSEEKEIEKIMLSEKEIQMSKNATKVLSYTLVYKNGTARYFVEVESNYYEIKLKNEKITVDTEVTDLEKINEATKIAIESSNPNLLEIEEGETGQITLKSGNEVGETTITLRDEKSKTEEACKVEVKIPVTGLTLTPTEATILLENTTKITARPVPSNTTEKIIWNSSDTDIATVVNDGTVTGKKEGKVTITAKCGEQTATCQIIVTVPGKAATVTKDMYAKYVTNYDSSNHWQIFFSDLENIYLIYNNAMADPIYGDRSLKSAVDSGNYTEGTGMLADETRFPGYEWSYSMRIKNSVNTDERYQAYLFMMDSGEVWDPLYKTQYADYVIGGPTPEMVPQANMEPNRRLSSFNGGTGYGYYWQSQSTDGRPFPAPIDNGESYWLAGPNLGSSKRFCRIKPGSAAYSWLLYDDVNSGFRPVIKLNANVTLKSDDGGQTYQIQ